jgi:hypothetical protein
MAGDILMEAMMKTYSTIQAAVDHILANSALREEVVSVTVPRSEETTRSPMAGASAVDDRTDIRKAVRHRK